MTTGEQEQQEEFDELAEMSADDYSQTSATGQSTSPSMSTVAVALPSSSLSGTATLRLFNSSAIHVDRTSDRLNMAVKQLIEFDKKEDYRHRGVPLQAVMEFMHQMFPEWYVTKHFCRFCIVRNE